MDLVDQIGIKIKIKIPTEDKEVGPTITIIQEAEITVEVTVEATHKTQDTHRGGTINPHNLSNCNHDRNNHSN